MIEMLLAQMGPCLSTDLADQLAKVAHLTPAAARQRVSRARAPVKRLASLPFARKARFLYLEKDYRSPWFWQALTRAIFESGGPYARALGAVTAREIVPLDQFHIACGAPLQQKGHIFAETVLKRMIEAGVLTTVEAPGLGTCVVLTSLAEAPSKLEDAINRARGRIISEDILLDTMREWVKNMALASYGKVQRRGDKATLLPKVGTFAWDLTGPSYVAPLVTWPKAKNKNKKPQPGFLVCDVLLNGEITVEGLAPFLHKCKTVASAGRVRAPLAIFIAERYAPEAFIAARSAGIIPATPESLFGRDAAEGFRALAGVMTDAANGITVDPARFDDLFARLGKVEGAVGNMRGAFFELLVAEVVRRTASAPVRLNHIVRSKKGQKAEVDVWLIEPNIRARFIECKGRHPDSFVDDDEIVEWLTKRIPTVRDYLEGNDDMKGVRPVFELWVTGMISDHAKDRVELTRQALAQQCDVAVLYAEEIRAVVKAVNDPGMFKTFEKHFVPVVWGDVKKAE